jgi:hypothetical protein
MGDNPYSSPTDGAPRIHPLRAMVRMGLIATYPLLAVSMLAFMGLSFGSAFVAEFTVENQTGETITVTPVGTVGDRGDRHPLPVYMWPFPPIWAPQRGGFEIPPGGSLDIVYDMDDINFSEIVVYDHDGERGQLIVEPDPTRNQYHAPSETRFVISDLDSLGLITGPVRNAAKVALVPTNAPWVILCVLLGPWFAFITLSWMNRRLGTSSAQSRPVVNAK